jgi:hypothetical protein
MATITIIEVHRREEDMEPDLSEILCWPLPWSARLQDTIKVICNTLNPSHLMQCALT